jgi:RNA polymerase sigma factor (sigma-70 family)
VSDVLQLGLPLTLSRLRNAQTVPDRDTAWADFIAAHSDVVLRTCRAVLQDYDGAMDAYAHVLDALQADGYCRLREYVPDGKTPFVVWLVVVTRRLTLDHVRRRYGRPRSDNQDRRAEAATRRKLEDLVGAAIDPDELAGESNHPDADIRRTELSAAVGRALAALPPRDRLLLALRFEDQRPVKEIAGILGLSTVFHVYRLLNGLLERLRDDLRHRGIDGPDA